jgi:hypothetical protein
LNKVNKAETIYGIKITVRETNNEITTIEVFTFNGNLELANDIK